MVKTTLILTFIYFLLSLMVPWSVAVSLASVAADFIPLPAAFLLSWCLGIFTDSSHFHLFGISSAILITCVFVSWYLNTRYQAYARYWTLLVGTIGQIALSISLGEPIHIVVLCGQWLTILCFMYIRRKFFDRDGLYVGI